jgi:dihydrofolate reductase
MTKIIWHVTMSVDGFIAGPDDTMDWAFGHGPAGPVADELVQTTGAILAGRRWHDSAMALHDGRAGIYGGAWTGPVLVLTHHAPADPPDPEIRFVGGPIEDAVAHAREAAGGKHVGIFGAQTARQCLDAGLLDEIVIHLAPVLLGDGVRLYGGPGFPRVQLERIDATLSPQLTDLRFRVRRDRAGS